jgi:hypothetical protein
MLVPKWITGGILLNFRMWQTLVRDYGWSWQAAADWIMTQAQRSIIDPTALLT